ncbi:hypothetical protein TSACC_21496 [Terrimicrobium sacchariphilum]|uniref:Uncharacterized protein n=1 Tax=Terrimicrobium sacchariphilum TaxID=690879 RepID=A0A146G5N8_TERSA|nr:hypothetical protein [Terrimicrobium sacchariphilum]GAT33089.1 hypothetical protein TSACC_21496 [Terrimicrobium sacchariphilum]
MLEAYLSSGGLSRKSGPCVYALILIAKDHDPRIYIGRTGTSSKTGVDSPFGRLSTHLKKRGKTATCIFGGRNDPAFIESARVVFLAVHIPGSHPEVGTAEKWMIWHCEQNKKVGRYELLNGEDIPKNEPPIRESIRAELLKLYKKAVHCCGVEPKCLPSGRSAPIKTGNI